MYASYGARWRARGYHSPRATPQQLLRSFYIAERVARARAFGCHCSCFSLLLCVSVSRRFSSLPALCSRLCPALCSRLCRHSRLVSVGALLSLLSSLLELCLVSLPLFCSRLLLCFRLISPRLRLSLVAWPSTNVINISNSSTYCSVQISFQSVEDQLLKRVQAYRVGQNVDR